MIIVEGLTKRFGNTVAINDLHFSVQPGRVTGFLGPNGSGKSTTLRCMVDLDHPQCGNVTFSGKQYRQIEDPIRTIGVLLDASYVHPGRSARHHLEWLALSNHLDRQRVDEVLALVGLTDVAHRRVKTFSLGMKQRLGLAATMLGDPEVVILDEPANGLDPEGIRWMRDMLQYLAGQGRAVLVSSHQLSEMALMAEDLVVIGRGQLIAHESAADFIAGHTTTRIRVRSPQIDVIVRAVRERGGDASILSVVADTDGALVTGMSMIDVGELAHGNGAVVHELSEVTDSLEDAFLAVTRDDQEYRSGSSS
ncbi:MAG: ATP-binding cassette domain-containing protein [Actinomycetota bacterium]|nr:ATP-binding cassette domain-containing protein [Actinomycetota bacterium]